ncbi:MAG: response regulator [Chloroflexi bacterium]|nr:response regulator [Chloroflexota bacterium]
MSKTILYIDDNIQYLRMMHKMLTRAGYTVLEANDGMTGVKLAMEHHPDLVLTDMNMPDMHGLEVVARLRAAPHLKSMPIVAVTANAMHGDREYFLEGGCDGYLPKPITRKELFDTISELLGVR